MNVSGVAFTRTSVIEKLLFTKTRNKKENEKTRWDLSRSLWNDVKLDYTELDHLFGIYFILTLKFFRDKNNARISGMLLKISKLENFKTEVEF